MAALVNQTNVNVNRSFFTPASSTLGASEAVNSNLSVSSVTFYGGGGTIQPSGGAVPNVGMKLQDYPTDTGGPSTLTLLTEANDPSFIGINTLYFAGGANITSPTSGSLVMNADTVACGVCDLTNMDFRTSSINGTPLLYPNPRVKVLGLQTTLDGGGSTIVTLANTSTISFSVNPSGAVPTIVPYSVYTNPAGSYTIYGDPLAKVSYVTTYLTV
jgi:hypothetical protein